MIVKSTTNTMVPTMPQTIIIENHSFQVMLSFSIAWYPLFVNHSNGEEFLERPGFTAYLALSLLPMTTIFSASCQPPTTHQTHTMNTFCHDQHHSHTIISSKINHFHMPLEPQKRTHSPSGFITIYPDWSGSIGILSGLQGFSKPFWPACSPHTKCCRKAERLSFRSG